MKSREDRQLISRREVVQLALASGVIPFTGLSAGAQARTEIEVLMTTR